ncbi:MAG: hypothetical protein COT32_00660 [Candidatus Nealsonbacteria bacterium CG08_land_8_20_14_0_20_36_22]|nr:MAG: hypothetical protein COT32_00660 [Candidatus Nealsonbacteria bacterium CG08_land_8_20_14_0_20_36_22]
MDLYLFQLINQFAGKWFWLDSLGVFFAKYFEYVLVFCLILFLFLNFKKRWRIIVQALLSAVLARLVIVNFIRCLWQRPRPFIENNINLLLDYPNKASFPSGHAAFYFAISTIVFLYNKKAGVLFFIASFLISLARVFVGIHWPSDILVGAFIGILVGWLGWLVRSGKQRIYYQNSH